jgi:hypothetical protein
MIFIVRVASFSSSMKRIFLVVDILFRQFS